LIKCQESLRRKGVSEKIMRVIKYMYDEAKSTMSGVGCTAGFEKKVGFHQRSCLSPILFIIVMDAISEATMLYADDLIVTEESASNLQTRFLWVAKGLRE